MPSRLVVDGTMRRLATNESSPSAPPGALSNAESFFRYVISRTGFSASESALASLMHDYLAVHPSSADESGQAPLGLSETELAALTEVIFSTEHAPSKSSQDGHECSVCLMPFKQQQVLKRLPCSHTFCKRCTCRWMEWHTTCPLCRTDCRFPNGVSATYSPRSRALRPVSAQPPSERRLGADDTIYSREPLASPTVDSTAPVPPSTPVHSTEQRRPQPPGPTHPPRTERMPSSCRNPASSGPPAAEGPTSAIRTPVPAAASRVTVTASTAPPDRSRSTLSRPSHRPLTYPHQSPSGASTARPSVNYHRQTGQAAGSCARRRPSAPHSQGDSTSRQHAQRLFDGGPPSSRVDEGRTFCAAAASPRHSEGGGAVTNRLSPRTAMCANTPRISRGVASFQYRDASHRAYVTTALTNYPSIDLGAGHAAHRTPALGSTRHARLQPYLTPRAQRSQSPRTGAASPRDVVSRLSLNAAAVS